jgi:hypothetical protein
MAMFRGRHLMALIRRKWRIDEERQRRRSAERRKRALRCGEKKK